ncbi:hypothetical protein GGTG_02457 [Gaeumannomyces tritici R3-111a-1]|uniref:Cytochrome c oxidase assembly protein COX20, mitochondrial n=1 Tax=Gaeumannomyces tritici (strain R3-111a-1) TaxID=644352 RepID=J3NMF3_GAET3|nr:hypothetical protein GGTG_02457 [Gaeumannomyces tritici R3-111a-1]EJT82484.1 hypothetical protein GGTG_02457 [Gaeumannomyces tritici R3-111a-1]
MSSPDDEKPPAWRAQEFAAAPTEDQLRALRVVEQQQQDLKAKLSGQQRATIGEAVGTIKPEDFLAVHNAPCSRQGLLTGIGGGAGVGALRFVLGAPIPKAANWAAGAFVAFAVGSYEYCQYSRRVEREKLKRAVEVFDRKAAELRKKAEDKKRQDAEAAAAEEASRLASQKRWYKLW